MLEFMKQLRQVRIETPPPATTPAAAAAHGTVESDNFPLIFGAACDCGRGGRIRSGQDYRAARQIRFEAYATRRAEELFLCS